MELSVDNICKNYGEKNVLNNISLSFSSGKLHALLGENGAGKSTLAKIISGHQMPSSGKILIDGTSLNINSPEDALKNNIVIVNQRPLLSDTITAYENINLKIKESSFFIKKPSSKLIELKNKWAPELNLMAKVKDLSGNNRFYVSLLGSLMRNPDILILDEPCAFLEQKEREQLYKNLHELTQNNKIVIVITHSFAEAVKYANTITLLEKEKGAHFFSETKEFENFISKQKSDFKNDNFLQNFHNNENNIKTTAVEYINFSAKPVNRPIILESNFSADYGTITAITGNQTGAILTLENIFSGMEKQNFKGKVVYKTISNSQISFNLKKSHYNTRNIRNCKVAIIPSDKNFRASNPALTVNQTVCAYSKKINQNFTKEIINKANINCKPEQKISELSGGMLQRLILQRELSQDPDIIIMCNPMHGLDSKSQYELCTLINQLKQQNKCIIIIGAWDFPLSLCSKVYELEDSKLKLKFNL